MRRFSALVALTLLLPACGEDSDPGEKAPPDETAPVVSFDQARFSLLQGTAELAVTVTEEHLAAVKLFAGETLLAEAAALPLAWDTTAVADDLYRLTVVAVDEAGNEGRSAEVPVIVANHGKLAEVDVEPGPETVVEIPENYESVEIDVRVLAESEANIRKVITWMTWDPADGWLLEYSLGQGLCPHRGKQYLAEESRDGEIVLALDRADVDPAIVATFPAAERESDTFPTNDDPLTYGMFFGHVKPMEPAEHVGMSLPFEAGIVFLYADAE
jgi:hypothetical protein